MADYREIVTGTIVHKSSGAPVAGATVEVYDKDLLINDHLGTTTTDEAGRFRVAFGWADYKDAFLEDRPDIFLKVSDPASGETLKTGVYAELKGEMIDDDTEVMDLGQIELGA